MSRRSPRLLEKEQQAAAKALLSLSKAVEKEEHIPKPSLKTLSDDSFDFDDYEGQIDHWAEDNALSLASTIANECISMNKKLRETFLKAVVDYEVLDDGLQISFGILEEESKAFTKKFCEKLLDRIRETAPDTYQEGEEGCITFYWYKDQASEHYAWVDLVNVYVV
jgi:hypothetical protein